MNIDIYINLYSKFYKYIESVTELINIHFYIIYHLKKYYLKFLFNIYN